MEKGDNKNRFYLDKWFLDMVTEEGEAMIFYAAKLKWKGLEVPYTSWLHNDPIRGVSIQSRFRKVNMPEVCGSRISWEDSRFGISGEWMSLAASIQTRVFESEEGYLDWKCYQPKSEVTLKKKGKTLKGIGYVEQLILTTEPWKIPMDDLRWGRYGGGKDDLVWIELRGNEKQQWLWHKGEKIENAQIEDDFIEISEMNLKLKLDRGVVLESEKKIMEVAKKLVQYLPGLNKTMPMQFLMADEHKWLSRAVLEKEGEVHSQGWAIHEWVKFN